jgi:V/A-type H+-transporting ATPase subunit I
MRVPLRKILFIGSKEAHGVFFDRAQKIGWFEFISVSGTKPHLFPKPMEDLKLAIKILKKQPIKEAPMQVERLKARPTIERIIEIKHEIEKKQEERRLLGAEIIKVHPLGEFDVEEFEALKNETGKFFQFVFIRHERLKKSEIPLDLIFIKRELDFDYYLYIGSEKFCHQAFTEVYVRKSLSDLLAIKNELNDTIHLLEKELKDLTCYQQDLEEFFLEELSSLNLAFAKSDVDYYNDEGLFVIEAWVPHNKTKEIKNLIKGLPIYHSEVAEESHDVVPTYLENTGLARIGQDLVEIYDTPSTTDKDPSLWVVCSFALFFGMIVSDAGYGLLFLLAALFFRYKHPNAKGVKKRILNLALILSCTSIIWGTLIASYFSIGFEPTNPLAKTSILYHLAVNKIEYHMKPGDETFHEWVKEYPKIAEAKTGPEALNLGYKEIKGEKVYKFMSEMSDTLLLEIAILVGIIHMMFSFLRNLKRNWSGIGWVITMWGAYLYFPKIVDAVSLVQCFGFMSKFNLLVVGKELLYGGLGITVALSLIQQKWMGLLVISKLIEVFSDVLSYLRLYALGLAGMIMASTFNSMGEMVGGGILGALVIFFGHSVNITLTISAGVLHGLRLNFLEWYHHSFEGGGKKFRPLKVFNKE